MAFIEGRISTVSCNSQNVGGLTEASMTLGASEIETTTHGSSTFKSFIAGRKDCTVSLSCLFDDSDAGQEQLISSWNFNGSGTVVSYVFVMGSGGSYDQYTCDGIITDLSYGTPNDDVATLDVSIRLTGALTIA